MVTVRFGAKCDRCWVIHNDYDVGDIAWCEDCGLDLCDKCAELDKHQTIDRDERGRIRHCEVE